MQRDSKIEWIGQREFQRVKKRNTILHLLDAKTTSVRQLLPVSFDIPAPLLCCLSCCRFQCRQTSQHWTTLRLQSPRGLLPYYVWLLVPVGCRVMHQHPSVGLNGWLQQGSSFFFGFLFFFFRECQFWFSFVSLLFGQTPFQFFPLALCTSSFFFFLLHHAHLSPFQYDYFMRMRSTYKRQIQYCGHQKSLNRRSAKPKKTRLAIIFKRICTSALYKEAEFDVRW